MIWASSASSSLPWLADRLQDRRPPLLQLPQVAQPLLERAELGVVEAAGHLLAVPGDEGDGGAAVEQVDGRLHLVLADAELLRDPLVDRVRHCRHGSHLPVKHSARRPAGRTYFTAPAVRPGWICRWKNAYTMIIGRIAMVSAANSAAQSAS